MHPLILGIDAYIVMAVIGFAAAFFCGWLRRKIYGYKPLDLVAMLCVSIMGLTVGAKLLFIITEIPALVNNRFSWEIVKSRVINGGFVFYGGLAGALLCIYWLARYMKTDARKMLNFAIPCFTVFHAIGRIGCLLEGCCYGVEAGWGIVLAGETVKRVPTQLIEAIVLVIISAILLLRDSKQIKSGKQYTLLPLYIIMYAPARFIIECWRGDVLRGVSSITVNYNTADGHFLWNFNLSTSQIISIILVVGVGIYELYKLLLRRHDAKAAAVAEVKADETVSENAKEDN